MLQAAEAEEERKAQEEADAERRAQSQAGTASTSGGQPGTRCAPQAAAFDALCQEALLKAQASSLLRALCQHV